MISVIVPYKNAEPWIGRCISSLSRQKDPAEFLLIDDASTDGSKAIVRSYAEKDPRIIMLDNERAPGGSGARNTGLDHVTGGWVTFLDADDEMRSGGVRTLDRITEVGASAYQLNHLRFYAKLNKTALKYTNPPGQYTVNKRPKLWCMVWNKLYKADLLQGVRFEEGLQYGEDEIFVLSCFAKHRKLNCVNEVAVVHHFDNRESLSKKKDAADLITQVRALERFLLNQDSPEVRCATCEVLSERWSSPTYRRILGLEE